MTGLLLAVAALMLTAGFALLRAARRWYPSFDEHAEQALRLVDDRPDGER